MYLDGGWLAGQGKWGDPANQPSIIEMKRAKSKGRGSETEDNFFEEITAQLMPRK